MAPHASDIAYIGPTGAGLGFSLSGIHVEETEDAAHALSLVREWKANGAYTIIFLDEALAAENLDMIRTLNEDPLPAIMLLPNPSRPTNTAAQNLQQLMIRAIGSDIFST